MNSTSCGLSASQPLVGGLAGSLPHNTMQPLATTGRLYTNGLSCVTATPCAVRTPTYRKHSSDERVGPCELAEVHFSVYVFMVTKPSTQGGGLGAGEGGGEGGVGGGLGGNGSGGGGLGGGLGGNGGEGGDGGGLGRKGPHTHANDRWRLASTTSCRERSCCESQHCVAFAKLAASHRAAASAAVASDSHSYSHAIRRGPQSWQSCPLGMGGWRRVRATAVQGERSLCRVGSSRSRRAGPRRRSGRPWRSRRSSPPPPRTRAPSRRRGTCSPGA